MNSRNEKCSKVIAFLDDYSRHIIHLAFIPSKSADICCRELMECLQKCPEHKFACLHCDNGKEFWGNFDKVL